MLPYYSVGKSIGNYAKTDYQKLDQYGSLKNEGKFKTADTIGMFIDPLGSFVSGLSGEGWTPQERADKINQKGKVVRSKMEAEKAAKFKESEIEAGYGGNYWDSNNMMVAAYGGELDDPYKKQREWLSNWYNNPETKIRMGSDSSMVPEITNKITSVPIEKHKRFANAGAGWYDSENEIINIPNKTNPNTDSEFLIHELNHATEYVPNFPDKSDTSTYIKGVERIPNSKYYTRPGEQHSRFMEIRHFLKKNPGEQITPSELKSMKQIRSIQELKKIYNSWDALAKQLNAVASTSKLNAMANGGDVPPLAFQGEPMQPPYNTTLNFSYLNPLTGEPTTTYYVEQPDQEFPNQKMSYSGYRKQTPEEIKAYREQIQNNIERNAPIIKKAQRFHNKPKFSLRPAEWIYDYGDNVLGDRVEGVRPANLGSGCKRSADKRATRGAAGKMYDIGGYLPIVGQSYEDGGSLTSQVTEYNGDLKHSENPIGGTPVDAQGNRTAASKANPVALVEGGEVSYFSKRFGKSYVFSDKIKI